MSVPFILRTVHWCSKFSINYFITRPIVSYRWHIRVTSVRYCYLFSGHWFKCSWWLTIDRLIMNYYKNDSYMRFVMFSYIFWTCFLFWILRLLGTVYLSQFFSLFILQFMILDTRGFDFELSYFFVKIILSNFNVLIGLTIIP